MGGIPSISGQTSSTATAAQNIGATTFGAVNISSGSGSASATSSTLVYILGGVALLAIYVLMGRKN